MITAAIWCMAVMFYGRYCQNIPEVDELSKVRVIAILLGIAAIPCAAILATIAVNK